jgi:proliferating cell nuclear antigen
MPNPDSNINVLEHKISPNRLLEVVTTQGSSFKTLMEPLKDILPEAGIEFIYRKGSSGSTSSTKNDDDTEEELSSKLKKTKISKKTKTPEKSTKKSKSKTKKKYDSEDEEEEVVSKKKSSKKNDDDEDDDDNKCKGEMRLIAMNTAKTVLVSLRLDAFDIFYCAKKKITIGVDMVNFYKFIKNIGNDDTLTLFLDKDNENQLGIHIIGGNSNMNNISHLNLMDLGEQKFKIPQIKFDAYIIMSSSMFQTICKNMNAHAEKIEIMSVGEQLRFTCKSEIGDQTVILSSKQDNLDIQPTKDGIIQGTYELKNLILFTKCSGLCTNIELYMKNDYPLLIKYTVSSLGKIIFCATPIKQNDD